MSIYNSVTFYVRSESAFWTDFAPEYRVADTPIPGGTVNDVQFLGKSNNRVEWEIRLPTAAAYASLAASQGATLRTLTKPDATTLANVMLIRIGPPRTHKSGILLSTVEFQVGTA